jgi:chemotaxis methyl-accepting protein methylase
MPLDTQTTPKSVITYSRDDDARDPTYVKIRDLVYQACGIYHSDEKLYLLAGACKRRMPNTKATDSRQYLELLSGASTRVVELRE